MKSYKYEFVNLHTHTMYSLLDGVGKSKDYIARCKEIGTKSLGISDHGNMYGIVDFYTNLKSNGIKPIIGQEFYMVPDRTVRDKDIKPTHLLVLAKNEIGYNNLMQLSSDAWVNGLYYKPRTDLDALRAHSKGLIVTTACYNNDIARLVLRGKIKKAIRLCKIYRGIFGKDFYLEIQPHDMDEYRKLNMIYAKLSGLLDIPIVATNDCHYPELKDSFVQDVLLLIQTKKTLRDVREGKDVFQFKTKEFYLKSGDEMYESFKKYHPDLYHNYRKKIIEAIVNSTIIAERCNVELPLGVPMIPSFGSDNPDALLFEKCKLGWKKKIEPKIGGRDKDGHWVDGMKYNNQLEKELRVITDMKLSDYFLIIRDMVRWAKKNGIMVGVARGSVAGSLVAYVLDITDIDPIKFNLMFERFLTYDRTGVGNIPDIDLDFQHDRRNEVKQYIEERWGKDRVAAIITFGTMGARSVLKDVARVFSVDYNDINFITKSMSQEDTLEKNENFMLRSFQKEHKKLYRVAQRLEGQARHYGVHAAGILITDKPIREVCPIQVHGKDKTIVSQWSMYDVVKRGLLKVDLLGLKTLTIFKHTLKLIKERHGRLLRLNEICLTDKRVFKEFCAGNTMGVFQFENPHFQDLLRAIKPSTIEDLAIANTLGRPGAKLAQQDQIYLNNKRKGRDGIKYVHPALKSILGRTYGAIAFQEQVMAICNQVGDIPIAETNNIREAIKHFEHDVMESYKKKFIRGATKNGVREDLANGLWKDIETHSSYSFNRNHATSYSLLGYYCMYLKTYYPIEFMTAMMNSDVGNEEQIRKYVRELKRLNIPFWIPEVMHSEINYSIKKKSGREGILCGFLSIKGIGYKTAVKIIDLRKQHGDRFLEYVPTGALKKLGAGGFKLGGFTR